MFVKLKIDDVTIDTRTYAAGSVVETEDGRGKGLVALGHAEPHDGPAAEPTPAPEKAAAPPPADRTPETETATTKKSLEKAVNRR